MVIPPESLSPDTLQSILEEFISREGTDYGEHELSLEDKVRQLKPQVIRGDVLIIFDPAQERVTLLPKQEWQGE